MGGQASRHFGYAQCNARQKGQGRRDKGIGTSSPSEKLSVTGNVRISDTLKIEKSLRIDSLAGESFKFYSTDTKSYKKATAKSFA